MKKVISLVILAVMICALLPCQGVFAAKVVDENVALGKPASANFSRPEYTPSIVVDGNVNTMWAGPTSTKDVWVMVDLETPHIISSVVIYNRNDVTTEQYRRFVNVEFANNPDFSDKEVVEAMGATAAPFGVGVEVIPPSNKPYRYVRAVKMNMTTHCVNEIEIYGHELDPNEIKIGTDVEGTDLEGPVTLMSYLGLMELANENDEIFGVDTVITRAAAIKEIVNVFGNDMSYDGDSPFCDVSADIKYYDKIIDGYCLGYIMGDGNCAFRPDDYVTKNELLIMVMRAIGYSDLVAAFSSRNMTEIYRKAKQLGLFAGLNVNDYSEPVTRGEAVKMFYNALLAPQMTLVATENDDLIYGNDDNMLYTKYGIVLTRGIVEENRITTLDGDPKKSNKNAQISGEAFIDPNGKLDAFLGNSVVVATRPDVSKEVLFGFLTRKDDTVVIPANKLASSVSDIKSNNIAVYRDADSNKKKTYKLENKFNVIKNNKAHPYYDYDDLLVKKGQLRLLDNDDNGAYDVVFIEEYTLHYVETSFYDDVKFTFIDSVDERISLDKETLTITNAGSGVSSPRKVTSDTVIKLFKNSEGKYSRIDLYSEPVIGVVTGISSDSISIDDVAYPLSWVYVNDNKQKFQANLGESVSAFVDESGEVLWVEKDFEVLDGQWIVAFSQVSHIKSGFSSDVSFRVFNELGKWEILEVASRVTVDGKRMDENDFAALVNNNRSNEIYEKAMLRYKLNEEGLITDIDTEGTPTAEEMAMGSYFQKDGDVIGVAMYTTNSHAFWSMADGEYQQMLSPAKSSTPVFMIPKIKTLSGTYEYTTEAAYDKLYSVTPLLNICHTHQSYDHQLQGYMPDELGYPACFTKTLQKNPVSSGSDSIDVITEGNSPFMVVEEITHVLNEDEEAAIKVKGRSITSTGLGGETTFFVNAERKLIESGLMYQESHEGLGVNHLIDIGLFMEATDKNEFMSSMSDIGYGDIVRYQLLGTEAVAIERVFDYNASILPVPGSAPKAKAWYVSEGSNVNYYNAYYRYQMGDITATTDDAFSIKTIFNTDEIYLKAAFSKVLLCDGTVMNPVLSEATALEKYMDANAKIVLFSYNGSPRTAIIYQY